MLCSQQVLNFLEMGPGPRDPGINRPILPGPTFCQDPGRSLGSRSGLGFGLNFKIDYEDRL